MYVHVHEKLFPLQRTEKVAIKENKTKIISDIHNKKDQRGNNKSASYADILKSGNIASAPPPLNRDGSDFNQLSSMMMRFMESMEKNMNLMMQNISSLIQLLTQNIAQK